MAELQSATTGRDFARLLWLVEDLIYTDLLKGTGWGRKRVWFREQLEACNTVSQVGRCAFAGHAGHRHGQEPDFFIGSNHGFTRQQSRRVDCWKQGPMLDSKAWPPL